MLQRPESRDKIAGWSNHLAGEIRSSITYYQDQAGYSQVEGVLLSGRGALIQGLAEHLESYLNLPVRNFNPLEVYAPARRKLVESDFHAIEYAISTGLAIRGLEV